MTSILHELANAARERVNDDRKRVSYSDMRALAYDAPEHPSFIDALRAPGMSFICECKKASPSKGLIEPNFAPADIARAYEDAGAAAISVLSEPTRFLGSDEYVREVANACKVPVLRKDFTVNSYMIYQARALGASAVLLICSLLDKMTLAAYLDICYEIGINALVEAHNADEVKDAVDAGAQIIGVNNRNLADFSVDFDNALRLRELVPSELVFVAESGVKSYEDVELLASHGVDAVLIGETLMRAMDKRSALAELKGAAQ